MSTSMGVNDHTFGIPSERWIPKRQLTDNTSAVLPEQVPIAQESSDRLHGYNFLAMQDAKWHICARSWCQSSRKKETDILWVLIVLQIDGWGYCKVLLYAISIDVIMQLNSWKSFYLEISNRLSMKFQSYAFGRRVLVNHILMQGSLFYANQKLSLGLYYYRQNPFHLEWTAIIYRYVFFRAPQDRHVVCVDLGSTI